MDVKQSILDRDKTIWIATLESGEEVWQRIDLEQDDDTYSSWAELKKTNPKITGLRVRFRSHTEEIPWGADGYYFRRGAIAELPGTDTINCYVTGYIQDGILHKIWWKIPEITVFDHEIIKEWDPQELGLIIHAP